MSTASSSSSVFRLISRPFGIQVTKEGLEGISHYLPEGPVKSEFSHSSVPKRDRDGTPQKSANTLMTILGQQWVVPWAAGTILQVALYWARAFWFIGFRTVRCAAQRYGCNVKSFTYEGKALNRLVTEVTQALAGITILWLCLYQYRPLPPHWFRFSLKEKWPLDVLRFT